MTTILAMLLILNSCYSQDYKIEEQLLNRRYELGKDYGLDLEHEYCEFKKYLLRQIF